LYSVQHVFSTNFAEIGNIFPNLGGTNPDYKLLPDAHWRKTKCRCEKICTSQL